MTVVTAVFVGVLGVWFAVSVAAQFRDERFEKLRRFDVFGLVPLFTFFAPNPGHSDQHLLYRDRSASGAVGEWVEIPLVDARRWYSVVWGPDKREKKILADAINSLMTSVERQSRSGVDATDLQYYLMLSVPYLTLLNVVVQRPAAPDVTHRQFVVAETFGLAAPRKLVPLFSSPFHALASSSSSDATVLSNA